MKEFEQSPAARVFYYFEQLCAIPHGSGNTKAISDFCVEFAWDHLLEYRQDALNNVIIIREASPGYEREDPFIIQGHLDMVCEKETWRGIDFETEGLDLFVDGDFLAARGTTLGADDGIAVACALALLEKEDLRAPRIEAVFTADEETGMDGVKGIDVSMLKGRRMLNLDSEEEGIFLCGCAGGLRADVIFDLQRIPKEGRPFLITIDGLTGGHSGTEIGKGHANAIQLLGRMLRDLRNKFEFDVITVFGGSKDNAIPREAGALILLPQADTESPDGPAFFLEGYESEEEKLQTSLRGELLILQNRFLCEYQTADPGITISIELAKVQDPRFRDLIRNGPGMPGAFVFPEDTAKRFEEFLCMMPNDVQRMSADIPGLVETSLNAGILTASGGESGRITVTFSLRSSVTAQKTALAGRLAAIARACGGVCREQNSYPAWEYRKTSPLREQMIRIYEQLFHETPAVEIIHAGLECGLFQEKIEGLDCVSFGPQINDIHTPKERLCISSTERLWEFLLTLLSEKGD